MNRKTGFMRVELLFAIGIMAFLISMLLPALNKAHEASKTVHYTSNIERKCD